MSVVETERTGIIVDFYDQDSGLVKEDGTGNEYDFVQHGAKVNFVREEGVIFITIQTPSGKIIVKSIGKKV